MARFFVGTHRHMTHVFTCVAVITLLLFTLPLGGGCSASSWRAALNPPPAGKPTGFVGFIDSASGVVGNIGEAVAPFNPILGSALMGVAGIGATVALRERSKNKKLTEKLAPWNGSERRTKARDIWDQMRRDQFRKTQPLAASPAMS